MKRFISVLLTSLLFVLSVPAVPAKSAPLYLTGDQAYEIYLSILSLIETGRLASGYDNSIFSSDFADFQSNIAEINSYLASHSQELNGIDFYWTDGSSALKEDWVDEDWDLDGDGTADATGTLSNKLSVLTQDKIDELENFNSGMNDNSFNEENNNPFDILKRVAIGAAVTAGGVFACLKGFWGQKGELTSSPSTVPVLGYTGYQEGMYKQMYYIGSEYTYMAYNYDTVSGARQWFYRNGNTYTQYYGGNPNYYTWFNKSFRNNTWENGGGYLYGSFSALYFTTNLPIFTNYDDGIAWSNGDNSKIPSNQLGFNFQTLNNELYNSLLPLIDTNIRPYGFIGIANGLSVARHDLNLSSDPAENTQQWLIDVPDTIGDIIPEYIPDYDPIPPPVPVPDPDPIPDPIPDPEPEPDPDPDIGDPIVDDEGDLTEIPIVEGLQGRFPFSIPWDIKHLISNLSAEREAPSFEYDFYISPRWLPPNGFIYHFEIDLSSFDFLASLFRRLFLLSFIIGLAVYSYAKFFGGGE